MSNNDWAVFRQDFTGNEFLVEKHLTEERARELVEIYEARKHHQHYWARRAPDIPIDYVQMLRDLLSTGSPLDSALLVLRNQDASLQQCIEAVSEVRGLSPIESKRVVLQSSAYHRWVVRWD